MLYILFFHSDNPPLFDLGSGEDCSVGGGLTAFPSAASGATLDAALAALNHVSFNALSEQSSGPTPPDPAVENRLLFRKFTPREGVGVVSMGGKGVGGWVWGGVGHSTSSAKAIFKLG